MTMTRSLVVGTTQTREYGETADSMGVSYGSPLGSPPTVEVKSSFRGLDTEAASVVTPEASSLSQVQIGSLLDHRLRMFESLVTRAFRVGSAA